MGDWFSAVETAECPYILWFVWRDGMHTRLSAQAFKWSAVRVPLNKTYVCSVPVTSLLRICRGFQLMQFNSARIKEDM